MIRETIISSRLRLRLTKKELAKRAKMRPSTLTDYELGKQGLHSKNLEKLFKQLKIKLKQEL
jgi:transcriptional regulator with XRE-family HTH domain